MQVTIPLGTKLSQTEDNSIQLHVPNTQFWIHGIQKPCKKWNAYLVDPATDYKEILRANVTTKSFSLFSNIILKTPFPFKGKTLPNAKAVKKFINKLIN